MRRPVFLLALTFIPCFALATSTNAQPRAKVHYIDVGEAESILLEFEKAVVLIDAGGEETNDEKERNHLIDYLTTFFASRSELQKTIDTIIITHPNSHHTAMLPAVMKAFTVKNLIDNGETRVSVMSPLRIGRALIKKHGGRYFAVSAFNTRYRDSNPALAAIQSREKSLWLSLLGGGARCSNADNNSIVLAMSFYGRRFLFAGDAGNSGDRHCRVGELTMLLNHYPNYNFLEADVHKVNGHGSLNGTDQNWLNAIRPKISVISAGKNDPEHRVPNESHAWQLGHPRESVVRLLERFTSGERSQKTVTTMADVKQTHDQRVIKKAVYCTCWDGDIVIDPITLEVWTSASGEWVTLSEPQLPPVLAATTLNNETSTPNKKAPPSIESLAKFDRLPLAEQERVLSETGPQIPNEFAMNQLEMRVFIRGNWPIFVSYSLKGGAARVTISADGIESFTKVLEAGVQQTAQFNIPERFGAEVHPARISIKTELTDNADASSGFNLHAIGILEKDPSSNANHPRYNTPLPPELPIGDIILDRNKIRTSNGEEVSYKFFSRSPYTSGAAEFFLFTYSETQGVIPRRVFSSQYENIRANKETELRKWNGSNRKGEFSFGVHLLQIRTWRGKKSGGLWFGPYYGPQVQVIQ